MKNKGFSMIELIIVIAIMAILCGALTPMLIKHINKARLSRDIDMGREIATTIISVVADEAVKDNAKEHDEPWPVKDMDGSDFKKAVYEQLSVSEIKGKSQKDVDGNAFEKPGFYYTLDAEKNKVEVYYGGTKEEYQIYPKTGSKLIK